MGASADGTGRTSQPQSAPNPWIRFVTFGVAAALAGTGALGLSTRLLDEVERETMDCGGFEIGWSNPAGATATLVVQRDEEIVHVVRGGEGEFLAARWCGDLVDDGGTVLVFNRYSGGAHCCTTVHARRLAPASSTLLTAAIGNAFDLRPRQLDGVGALELQGASDIFAYFDGLSFAASPSLPLVYRYTGDGYVEATREFRSEIRANLDEAWTVLERSLARDKAYFQDVAGGALWVLGDSLLLGRGERGLERVRKTAPERLDRWIDKHYEAAAQLIAERFR